MPCRKNTLAFFLIALGLTGLAMNAKAQSSSDRIAPEVAGSADVKTATATRTEVDPKTADGFAPGTSANGFPQIPPPCRRTINADVVALAQPIMLNRLGAAIPDGLVFALKRDTQLGPNRQVQLKPDKRPRPLVLRANVGDCVKVTLTNAIPTTNFGTTKVQPPANAKTGTEEVSLHIQGMEWATGPGDDGSFVGQNNSSLASASPAPSPLPPQTQTYTLFAKEEGTFLMYTMGDTSTLGGQLGRGLFGSFNVEPTGAEWYRSQVSADDLLLATYNANRPDQVPPGSLVCTPPGSSNCTFTFNGKSVKVVKTPDFGSGPATIKGGYLNTLDNHPLVDYDAVYPTARLDGTPIRPDLVGSPILKMLDTNNNIVHSDLTAIITGPGAGRFPGGNSNPNKPDPPCNAENNPALNPPPGGKVDPLFCTNPAAPDRKQPYREITILYHEVGAVASQAFPIFSQSSSAPLADTVAAGFDGFAINYGTGGIASEVYANRIGVGPMGDCVDCKFEEFFLSAWSVGDPAMLVDRPANSNDLTANAKFQPPCNTGNAFNSPPCGGNRVPGPNGSYTMQPTMKASAAFFPDDPSNVYHSYINDHVKFRILHGGSALGVTHVHHQHAHQWLQSPNSDESSYLDSQMISPGASYTLEMVYNGSGNRNKVVGDSIFHCHFYPHFAAGMWAMWRTHDVFESGTFVYPNGTIVNGKDVSGQAVPGSRALPDGEMTAGAPTPAIVPLPTLPMAPLPAYAQIQTNVNVQGAATHLGGQVVIGGTCQANQINGLDVIGGCTNGQQLNGTVINSQYDFARIRMAGQFLPSPGNLLENPGYPYFIPGIAGARGPHPPLDFAPDAVNGGVMDGGLPRHLVSGGSVSYERHTEFDWSKDLATMNAVGLPEDGTVVEKAAISFFGKRCYPTFFPDGTAGSCPSSNSTPPQSTLNTPPTGFILNGLPLGPQHGAPFADPAVDDNGKPVGNKRTYKAAAIQLNVVFNKKGWHFQQQRMLALWKDVLPTFAYTPGGSSGRQPEPLFFRGNSGDVIEYWHTNLVPNYYLVDDYQVRTPTDILGQHIHLVKFDVTSSDGAGNGFNYEDGTFSPQEVQDTIRAINNAGGLVVSGAPQMLTPKLPPKDILDCAANPADPRCTPCPNNWTPTSRPECQSWMGAQTTIQRWYLDPLVDDSGVDRTMRTVFTHDHFGPSTHQQAGLYAGLLIEPLKSTWTSNDGTTTFGSRMDGGPTSWQARILTTNAADSYREFMLEFQDLQLAYEPYPDSITQPNPDPSRGWRGPGAINPMMTASGPRPRLISTANDPPTGTQSVNYLSEPLPWRVGVLGDLSYAYDNSAALKVGDVDVNGSAEPMTPLLRAYQNDKVQIRLLVGAHVFAHQFNLEGPTWFAEPAWKNSGYRSAQAMGLSEHFEFLFKVPSSSAPNTPRKCPDKMSPANCVDYLYSPSLDQTGVAHGLWGIFRSYDPTKLANKLAALPSNPVSPTTNVTYSTCPAILTAPAVKRTFNITAVTAQKALASRSPMPGSSPVKGQLVLNDRGNDETPIDLTDQLSVISANPAPSPAPKMLTTGIMYVRSEDLDPVTGLLRDGVPIEPLILRANAGDCIDINLTNKIDPISDLFKQNFKWAPPFDLAAPGTTAPAQTHASGNVGLHPQLLSYDAATSNGINVGWNVTWNISQGQTIKNDQVASFGNTTKYEWYAGKIDRNAAGRLVYTPVEFGSLNLFPSDPVFQHINGLFGSMIIEPAGSSWKCGEAANPGSCDPPLLGAPPVPYPPTSRTSATITLANGATFREFALMISDTLNSSTNKTAPGVQNITSSSAVNYRTEPQKFRYENNATQDFSCMTSNLLGQLNVPSPQQPRTPLLTAEVGDQVRFRMTHPFGTGTSQVFTLHGHVWQRNPYTNESRVIGDNKLSQWLGSRDNHGSTDHFDLVVNKAGGESRRAGDYLYTVYLPMQATLGAWGVFRVGHNNQPIEPNVTCKPVPQPGYVPVYPKTDMERFTRQPLGVKPNP